MLQLAPELSTAAISAIWTKAGDLGYVPNILRSGIVVPLFKKGDAADPRNYRPITLLSVLRKSISKSIGLIFIQSYGFRPRQLVFLSGSNTETAIAMASKSLQQEFKRGTVLDLKSAYDLVP